MTRPARRPAAVVANDHQTARDGFAPGPGAGGIGLLADPARGATAYPLRGFQAPFVFGQFSVPADNTLTEEAVELGRMLFYDARLSGDNTVACATCHLQRLAFTDGRVRAAGVSGKPLAFNSMSLANLLWGPQRFFWNGRADSLEQQALVPIGNPDEMNQDQDELVEELRADQRYRISFRRAYGKISAENIARALASFERTLVSANSRYDRFLRGEIGLSSEEELGRRLFMAHPDAKVDLRGANCIDCHSQFLTSGFRALFDGFSNNGLDGEANLQPGLQEVTGKGSDRGKFKVPTLRNVALTAAGRRPSRGEPAHERCRETRDHRVPAHLDR